jgi:hypothetical protein
MTAKAPKLKPIAVTEAREIAQDIIANHGPAQACEFATELVARRYPNRTFTEGDQRTIYGQIRVQSDRVYNLFHME